MRPDLAMSPNQLINQKGKQMNKNNLVHASQIINKVLKKLKPVRNISNGYYDNEISLDEIHASIAERKKLNESFQHFTMVR